MAANLALRAWHDGTGQTEVPAAADVATDATLRYLWQSRFGPMLIEIRQGCTYVNGQRVEPLGGGSTAAEPGA